MPFSNAIKGELPTTRAGLPSRIASHAAVPEITQVKAAFFINILLFTNGEN